MLKPRSRADTAMDAGCLTPMCPIELPDTALRLAGGLGQGGVGRPCPLPQKGVGDSRLRPLLVRPCGTSRRGAELQAGCPNGGLCTIVPNVLSEAPSVRSNALSKSSPHVSLLCANTAAKRMLAARARYLCPLGSWGA